MREVIDKIVGVEKKADKIIADARTEAAQLLSRTDEELSGLLREARAQERERVASLQEAIDAREAERVQGALEKERLRHAGVDLDKVESLARKVADRLVHTVFDNNTL